MLVECDNCRAKNTLSNMAIERLSTLEKDLTEGLLICPDCGHEKHCYFMSPKLKSIRDASVIAIKVLAARRTQKNFDAVRDIKEKYKNLFDEEQLKYQTMLNEPLQL